MRVALYADDAIHLDALLAKKVCKCVIDATSVQHSVANNLCFLRQELTVRSIKRPLQRVLDRYALCLASPAIF